MYPVSLRLPTVTLREFRADDDEAAHEIIGDDRVTRWLSFDSRDRQQATSMVTGAVERSRKEPRDEYYLAMAEDSGRLIGFVRLELGGVRAAKIGYAVRFVDWGKGLATEGVRAMLTFGFQELNLHRISAAIGPDNAASIALVTRLGFRREGRIRDHVWTNGDWRDSLLFSILDHEYLP